MFREGEAELLNERLLLGSELGDTAEANLAAVGGRENDIGALQGGE